MSLELLNISRFSYSDIMNSYLDCRKTKRFSKAQLEFEINLEENLNELLNSINNYTYDPLPYNCFVISDPKYREVWAAQFRDRILHRLIYNTIGSYFEKRFIEDTFSCIKTRGVLKGIERLNTFCRKITNNWQYSNKMYFAKMDISNFFVSISKTKLWNNYIDVIKNENLLISKLVKQNIFHNCKKNCNIVTYKNFSGLPYKKSLFHTDDLHGLPVGNITSQFYSNLYLDSVDKFIKHELKIKYYVRYVDDMVILSENKSELQSSIVKINEFLSDEKELTLAKNKTYINKISNGITFLGSIIKPYKIIPTKRTIKNFSDSIIESKSSQFSEDSICSLQSYLGLLSHSNTFNLRTKLLSKIEIPILDFSDDYLIVKTL